MTRLRMSYGENHSVFITRQGDSSFTIRNENEANARAFPPENLDDELHFLPALDRETIAGLLWPVGGAQ